MVNNYDVSGLDTHELGVWVCEYLVNIVTWWAVGLVSRTRVVTYCHDVEAIRAIITLQERGTAWRVGRSENSER